MKRILIVIYWIFLVQICLAQKYVSTLNLSGQIDHLSPSEQEAFLQNLVKESPYLVELHLSNNNLKQLPDEICNLKYLQKLYLHYNPITNLPQNIGNLIHLQELYLPDSLKVLPDSFFKLYNLENLWMESPSLQILKNPRFAQLRQLTWLYLGNIDTLPRSIMGLLSLKVLYLSDESEYLKEDWCKYKITKANEVKKNHIKNYKSVLFYYKSKRYEGQGNLKKAGKFLEKCYLQRKEVDPYSYDYTLIRTLLFYVDNNFEAKSDYYFNVCKQDSQISKKHLINDLLFKFDGAIFNEKFDIATKYANYLLQLGNFPLHRIVNVGGLDTEKHLEFAYYLISKFQHTPNREQLYWLASSAHKFKKLTIETAFIEKYLQLDTLKNSPEIDVDMVVTHLKMFINRCQKDQHFDLAIQCAKKLIAVEKTRNDPYVEMYNWRILAWLQRLNAQYTEAWASLQNSWQIAVIQRWGDERKKALNGFNAVLQDSKQDKNVLELLNKWYKELSEFDHYMEVDFIRERYADFIEK